MKNALTIFLIMLSVNVYAIQWCNDKHVDGISISLNGEIAYKVNRKDNSFKRLYRVIPSASTSDFISENAVDRMIVLLSKSLNDKSYHIHSAISDEHSCNQQMVHILKVSLHDPVHDR
jgi:hypothetical protein